MENNAILYKSVVLSSQKWEYKYDDMMHQMRLMSVLRGKRFESIIDTYQQKLKKIEQYNHKQQEIEHCRLDANIDQIHQNCLQHYQEASILFSYVTEQIKQQKTLRQLDQEISELNEKIELNQRINEQHMTYAQLSVDKNIINIMDRQQLTGAAAFDNFLVIAKTIKNSLHIVEILDLNSRGYKPIIINQSEKTKFTYISKSLDLYVLNSLDQCRVYNLKQDSQQGSYQQSKLINLAIGTETFVIDQNQMITYGRGELNLINLENGKKIHTQKCQEYVLTGLHMRDSYFREHLAQTQNFGDDLIHTQILEIAIEEDQIKFQEVNSYGLFYRLLIIPNENSLLYVNKKRQIICVVEGQQSPERLPISFEVEKIHFYQNKLFLIDNEANLYHIDKILAHFNWSGNGVIA